MLKVALTGNIGSGKTTASIVFKLVNVPVFDADIVAKQQYNKIEVVTKLTDAFGKNILTKDNVVNKTFIAKAIFNNDIKLKTLTNIIHPLVKIEFKNWCQQLPDNTKYCLHESAIIFEGGFDENIDYVIIITAPEHLRFERVKKRNNWKDSEIKAREKNQWDEQKKIKLSDFVIINDGQQALLPQIISLNNKLNILSDGKQLS